MGTNVLCRGYVFINFLNNKPLSYVAVRRLFVRLSKKCGFRVTPHMLRHTHTTELIRHGCDATFVHRRLGHSRDQTTLDIYSHLNQDDLKQAFQLYQAKKEDRQWILLFKRK